MSRASTPVRGTTGKLGGGPAPLPIFFHDVGVMARFGACDPSQQALIRALEASGISKPCDSRGQVESPGGTGHALVSAPAESRRDRSQLWSTKKTRRNGMLPPGFTLACRAWGSNGRVSATMKELPQPPSRQSALRYLLSSIAPYSQHYCTTAPAQKPERRPACVAAATQWYSKPVAATTPRSIASHLQSTSTQIGRFP
jgi:hypothetical protein